MTTKLLNVQQIRNVASLKDVIATKIEHEFKKISEFRKNYGDRVVSEMTISQIYGGMRGVFGLLCETSTVDPDEGVKFRGYTIPECQKKLPKAPGGEEPIPEGVFWLLCTGDIPTAEQVKGLSDDIAKRSEVPEHVITMLNLMPTNLHPMAQYSCAITALNSESLFKDAYEKGVKKSAYWETVYEDALNCIAKIPIIAAKIYRNLYKGEKGKPAMKYDPTKDWTENYALMLGYNDKYFTEMLRLYHSIHSDHEGGNVSAHTTHLVGSALSDPYLSYAAGMNGLAGPLHGLANQEVLVWLEKLRRQVGDSVDEAQLKDFIWKTLKSGQVVPGFGHAVLRKTDPRYLVQREFALKHLPDDPLFKIVSLIYKVVPGILQEQGKVKNPWPNVDAHSGVLMQHFGLREMQYYTVIFGVARALGVLCQLIWARALRLPIERPKSLSTDEFMKMVKAK